MFEFEQSMSRISAYELQRRARREQSLVVKTLIGRAARTLAQWLATMARDGTRFTRALAAERRLRRDIRTLQQLEERALRDMGLSRSEIERVVRYGRRLDSVDWLRRYAPAMAELRVGPGRTQTSN
jgi:uncharacterized protein YjiS (DUF1127 family)